MTPKFLSTSQIDEFIDRGYIILRNAFPRETASEWADHGFHRLGYDRHNCSTWKEPRIHMPHTILWDTAEFVPPVWKAACDLMGGEERVGKPYMWSDGFICNFGIGADKPWTPAENSRGGWHKDGDFFLHFLDSPEQALLTIVCWTDLVHQGGATFIAPDSVGIVAKFLADNPQGVSPFDKRWAGLIEQCSEFVELTAEAGDVVLHHPYMLHTQSQNLLKVERIITNPPARFNEPMNFNRDNPEDFSAVERAVLRGLGVERYDFKPTQPRERIVPPRVQYQKKLEEEEKARMAASSK